MFTRKKNLNQFLRGLAIYFFIFLAMLALSYEEGDAQTLPRFRLKEQRAHNLFRKGLRFYNHTHYSAARNFFSKALVIQPYFNLARRYLGDTLYYSGNWEEALYQWEFLDEIADGAYPITRLRSQLLRFQLAHTKREASYVFLKSMPSIQYPTDIAFDNEGQIYLSLFQKGNILKFTPSLRLQKKISGVFYDNLSSLLCLGVSQKNKRIYTCDYKKDRISVFDLKGKFLFHFGTVGSGEGQFRGPNGIIVHDNTVFISDSGNKRVQKFDLDGNFQLELGQNNLSHPSGLAISSSQILYVSDLKNKNILLFDLYGNFLSQLYWEGISKPRRLDIYEDKLIVTDEGKGIFFYDIKYQTWTRLENIKGHNGEKIEFIRPFAARVEDTGALYIADYGSNQLLVLLPLGLRTSNLNCRIEKIDASSFPNVAIFVSAKNQLGKPLYGLDRDNFRLLENDTPILEIKTNNMIPYNRRTSIAIIKENSNFYRERYSKYLDDLLGNFLANLRIADKVFTLEAGNDARLLYEGLAYQKIVRNFLSIENQSNSSANLSKAIYEGTSRLLSRPGARGITLFVSGKYFPNAFAQYSLQRLSQFLKSHNIPLYILSYEGESDPSKKKEVIEMYKNLANITKGAYAKAFNQKFVSNLYQKIQNQKDIRYIITYKSNVKSTLKDRYIDIELKLHHLGTSGVADSGYFID